MAMFQYNYLSKQAAGRNWPIGHSLQPLSQLTPDAQQLMVAEGRAVWPKPTMDSAGRVQQLSADPTSINREIITLKLQAFAGTISCSTWKSNPLPLPEERNFGHRNGGCHIPCRVPRLLQRLSSFPGPAQACGRASLSWAAAALHPSPACAQLGDTGALCFCSRLGNTQ